MNRKALFETSPWKRNTYQQQCFQTLILRYQRPSTLRLHLITTNFITFSYLSLLAAFPASPQQTNPTLHPDFEQLPLDATNTLHRSTLTSTHSINCAAYAMVVCTCKAIHNHFPDTSTGPPRPYPIPFYPILPYPA